MKSLLDNDRLTSLVKAASSAPPGDFVECGVFDGGSARVLAGSRRLWLFDSFQGLRDPVSEDGYRAERCIGFHKGSADNVISNIECANHVILKVGLFEHTMVEPLPEKIALLHVDCDWYSPTKLVLETLMPRVVNGGWIIVDDYGAWEGCRRAVDELCKPIHAIRVNCQLKWRNNVPGH